MGACSVTVCAVCVCLLMWLFDDPTSISLSVLLVVIIHLKMPANCDILLMQFQGVWIIERRPQCSVCVGIPSYSYRGPGGQRSSPDSGSVHFLCKLFTLQTQQPFKDSCFIYKAGYRKPGKDFAETKKKETRALRKPPLKDPYDKRRRRKELEAVSGRTGCFTITLIVAMSQHTGWKTQSNKNGPQQKQNIQNGKRTNHTKPKSITGIILDLFYCLNSAAQIWTASLSLKYSSEYRNTECASSVRWDDVTWWCK